MRVMASNDDILKILSNRSNKLSENSSPHKRIPRLEFENRMKIIDGKINKIMHILQDRYQDRIDCFINSAGRGITGDPTKFLKWISSEDKSNNRIVYDYVIELYVLVHQKRDLELNVENTIEYDDIVY